MPTAAIAGIKNIAQSPEPMRAPITRQRMRPPVISRAGTSLTLSALLFISVNDGCRSNDLVHSSVRIKSPETIPSTDTLSPQKWHGQNAPILAQFGQIDKRLPPEPLVHTDFTPVV
jgi:hypothetical protein